MQKILMQFNQQEYADRLKGYQVGIQELNDILEAYNNMGFDAIDYNSFKQLMHDPEAFVFNQMHKGETFKIGHLEIDIHKAFHMVKAPAGYDTLKALIDEFKAKPGNWSSYLTAKDIIDGCIDVCLQTREKLKQQCSIYAESESEKKAYELITKVIDNAKTSFADNKPFDLAAMLQDCIVIKPEPVMHGRPLDYVVNGRAIKAWAKRIQGISHHE